MSLRKPNAAASTTASADFEGMDDAGVTAAAAPAAANETPKTTALAKPATGALALNSAAANVLGNLKNVHHVTYNSLAQITAAQGAFSDRESGADLGKSFTMELLSWQDSFVCSPNDDKADKELVRYSDDGVTASDGTNMRDHLASLKADGWENAKISQRVVLVGAITSCDNTDFIGQLVQVDLAPTSKAQFDRHMITVAYKSSKGMIDASQANQLRLTAEVAKGQGTIKYTVVKFSQA